jgi:O-antigen ligase
MLMMRYPSLPGTTGATQCVKRGRDRDLAGITLLLFGGLNLNGTVLLLFGTQAFLSPLVLCFVLVLWLRYAHPSAIKAEPFVSFVVFLASYLAFATLFAATNPHFDTYFIKFYSATLLFVSGVYVWLTGCTNAELSNVFRMFKSILLVSCIFVPLSPYLSIYFAYSLPLERSSGLFANPNEAAVAALFCIVLIVAYPARNRLLTFTQAMIALLALLLTFSRTGFMTLVALGLLFVIGRRSLGLFFIATLALALGWIGLGFVFESDAFHLSYDQRERLADTLNVLSGEISAQTTTGRTLLWELGLRQIGQQLPWGSGIGEFHALVGGLRERPDLNKWLGVHNSYLMVLGEAGVVPFLLLIGFLIRLFLLGSRAPERVVAIGFGVILVLDMMSSHNTLSIRLSNVALAFVMVIAARVAIMAVNLAPYGLPRIAIRPTPTWARRPIMNSRFEFSPLSRKGRSG